MSEMIELAEIEDTEVAETAVPEIRPSEMQSRAIADIKDWYNNRSKEQQIYRLFGYAGTGKTTITKYAISDLGLSMFQPPKRGGSEFDIRPIPDVFFSAFTGKAAYVMRRHGTPAQTIHSMIYSSHERTPEEIEEAKNKLEALENEARQKTGIEYTIAMASVEALRSEIKKMREPSWTLDPFADVSECKLIVLDEVSMVNQDMAAHLMSYGKPILVLGDPGQLPPIKGEGAFTMQSPDTMLEEIHRQALDSPIIRLATMARLGQQIPFGRYSDDVWKINKNNISGSQMLNADQVICGKNATRYQLNAAMRQIAGFRQFGELPSGEIINGRPEKLICLKNMNSVGLINGMFVTLSNVQEIDNWSFSAKITTEEGVSLPDEMSVYKGEFLQHYRYDKERNDKDWQYKRGLIESTYGWAITGHKSQGSQWRNVLVYDDGFGRGDDRRKWLYTTITRAESGLVIAA